MSEDIEPHILRKYDIVQLMGKGVYCVSYYYNRPMELYGKLSTKNQKLQLHLRSVLMLFEIRLMLREHIVRLCIIHFHIPYLFYEIGIYKN